MNLPIYQIVHVKSAQLDDIVELLHEDLNLRRPLVFVLKTLKPDEQREVIGVIENWFDTHQSSWRFPYPVYFVSDHNDAIGTISVVSELAQLPSFYGQKEAKITVKEGLILDKNRLLQQEIKNADPHEMTHVIQDYAADHKKIHALTKEVAYYDRLLKALRAKGKQNG